MDNLTVTMTTHFKATWILKVLEDMVTWARIKFKTKHQGTW